MTRIRPQIADALAAVTQFAIAAAVVGGFIVALSTYEARAEGVIPTPWGWRAAPCCRDRGFQSPFQGRPPNEFLYGVLAPVFWGEIVPRLARILPPPPQPVYRSPWGGVPGYGSVYPPPVPPSAYAPSQAQAPHLYDATRRRPAPPRQLPPQPTYEPEPPPVEELPPPVVEAPPPPALAPVQPPDMTFIEFCRANPTAPPCRNRTRGQR